MRTTRLLATLAAALTILVLPGTAHAATITQPFAADSGDVCRYGATSGTLGWRYGATSPLPVLAVDVKGKLADRPLPSDPSTACRDDGYYTSATFTAYAGSVAVDRQTRTANNATVSIEFSLGGNSTSTGSPPSSAQPSTMRHRTAKACDDFARRDQRTGVSRSSSDNDKGAFGRPRPAIPQKLLEFVQFPAHRPHRWG